MAADPKSIDDLLATYAATAERWSSLQSDACAANKLFDENHRLYELLRVEPDGRDGIAKLMSHRDVGVRLLAAAHTLGWAPQDACAVLEAIEKGPGLHAVSANTHCGHTGQGPSIRTGEVGFWFDGISAADQRPVAVRRLRLK